MSKITGINIDYPIIRGNTGFFKQTFDTLSAKKSNIMILLKTIPGERIMNPEFGVGLSKYLFENITEELILHIETVIRNQINRYIPDINIDSLIIKTDYDEYLLKNKIEINIKFSLKNNLENSGEINIIV